ncbi:FKBP-type peptidyl-prolyl cis-trans isomerase [Plantactinospora mayteni]|jgi:peptidylprolyl isomerase|uniref:Peptidyl-prolyl cis-trans isomerase n=1 Tax=Plantactinospora mayteni TaxID=566021 RepID=A0ABQ4EWU8_9ACTN|nr:MULTISPECIES: FKBP-type peptidyl-prolyl cis-trans isomerase [Plantactinospora]MDW5330213.1 FKBP-type peptidyl-prolyl cis-trans isomerase [Plantactinospora sp. KLBMP9567]GIG99129.1 peptidyl-prolyl cis-trans isomerase [Plantactinospora mayteni]
MEKPTVGLVDGPPPADLVIEDITIGTGQEVQPGQWAVVHYVGVSFDTGDEFDSSWNRGSPFSFPVGGGKVIEGWDRGVLGMRVGGRRKLVIPPQLGYGNQGVGNRIKPGATLVFVVDLVDVKF